MSFIFFDVAQGLIKGAPNENVIYTHSLVKITLIFYLISSLSQSSLLHLCNLHSLSSLSHNYHQPHHITNTIFMLSIKQGGIQYHFFVFGMTQAKIEPRSPGLIGEHSTHYANGHNEHPDQRFLCIICFKLSFRRAPHRFFHDKLLVSNSTYLWPCATSEIRF